MCRIPCLLKDKLLECAIKLSVGVGGGLEEDYFLLALFIAESSQLPGCDSIHLLTQLLGGRNKISESCLHRDWVKGQLWLYSGTLFWNRKERKGEQKREERKWKEGRKKKRKRKKEIGRKKEKAANFWSTWLLCLTSWQLCPLHQEGGYPVSIHYWLPCLPSNMPCIVYFGARYIHQQKQVCWTHAHPCVFTSTHWVRRSKGVPIPKVTIVRSQCMFQMLLGAVLQHD